MVVSIATQIINEISMLKSIKSDFRVRCSFASSKAVIKDIFPFLAWLDFIAILLLSLIYFGSIENEIVRLLRLMKVKR